MKVEPKLKYFRASPRKMRLIADLIRGRLVEDAESVLRFAEKKSAKPILKLLSSAVANADHNFNLKKDKLYIKEIRVDEGPTLKRFMPRARGSVSPIHKKTSHVTIGLAQYGEEEIGRKGKKTKIKKIQSEEKPKEKITKEAEKEIPWKKEAPRKLQREKKGKMFRRKSI